MTPTPPLLRIEHLSKSYRTTRAIDDFSLALEAGRIVGLVGENGSGKTTLLKILAGVLAEWSGTVEIDGNAPGPLSKAEVAFLPAENFLSKELTAEDAIALYSRFFADFDAAKARASIGFFGLPTDRKLAEMSKGMGEKLQIALVMARRARLFLLDEPISGVDPAAREILLEGILRDFDENALMIMSTHLIADVEPILDEVVMMKAGRLLLAGNADDLREERGASLDRIVRTEYR